ncbi:RNA-binding domain-containing protein [Athelia psychrophila]|uniref:RNA-binding domain-containing protein n=1 Tax=Athelia psychrophila TaxID=1759441 RepID=A0A166RT16_9AGAM|nr:RNA-binding domain-containing protein [Fibularhizoctonia sp. CBS 109695]
MGSLRADSSGASSLQNSKTSSPSLPPTNDDIEAVIREATSARSTPDGRGGGPLKDTRTQLFVGNLPYRVRWQDLKDLFRKAGTVLRADVSLGPDNRSRGYGTVLLSSAEDAGRAVDMFNGYSWQTRILEVRPDRLPPDFENPMGLPIMPGSMPGGMPGFPPSLLNSPMSSSPFAPAGQTHPPMPTSMGGNGASSMADDFDYTSFYMHEAPGQGPNGGRNLFVGNLPFHCQWQDLKDLFRQAGTIIRADVALGQDGRSRGFGTVVFATDVDADRAVKMFNG